MMLESLSLYIWILLVLAILLTPWAIARYSPAPGPVLKKPELEIAKFRCQFCGREFDPDPRMICDGGLQPCIVKDGVIVPDDVIDLDFVREASDDELRAAGIEPDEREKLLRGEHVSTTFCICLECQNQELVDEPEDEA